MKVFGTDGIRGLATELLSADLPFALGVSFSDKKVVVGKDVRTSSSAIEKRLIAGLLSVGARVVVVGTLPTPALSYAVAKENADFGVMITASHNPPEFNGLKVFGAGGEKPPFEIERELDERVSAGKRVRGKTAPPVDVKGDYAGKYLRHAASLFCGLDLRGEKLVLDCACGCMTVLPPLFEKLGADVRVIAGVPSGERVNVGCGALFADEFAKSVGKDEVGLSFDGDGDRLIAVCDGKVYDGDRILCALAESKLRQNELNPPIVVGTVMTGSEVERYFEKKEITLLRTEVGDKHVSEKMQETGAILGGEKSGHIIQKRLAPTGDGLLTALSLLEAKRILGKLPYVKPNEFFDFSFPSQNPKAEFEKADFRLKLDEIRNEIGDKGRLIARPSGTEPLVRITVEILESELECRKRIEKILFTKN